MTEELRKHPRASGGNRAAIAFTSPKGAPVMCTVADISEGGAGLTFVHIGSIPDLFKLEIKGDPVVRTCRVAWRNEPHRLGVEFV